MSLGERLCSPRFDFLRLSPNGFSHLKSSGCCLASIKKKGRRKNRQPRKHLRWSLLLQQDRGSAEAFAAFDRNLDQTATDDAAEGFILEQDAGRGNLA